MDAFEEMRENLRLTIAIQAESAKELAALKEAEEKREEKRNAELAELKAQSEKELAALKTQSEKERIELRESLNKIGRRLGSVGINNGSFAEELFYTSLKNKPVLGDQTYDHCAAQCI